MLIGLVTGEGEEKSHCKVGTLWVRQTIIWLQNQPTHRETKIDVGRVKTDWRNKGTGEVGGGQQQHLLLAWVG